MATKIISAGIDRGFGATKYLSDISSGCIDSLVAPISKDRAKELLTNNKDDESVIMLRKDDNYYLIGDYVAKVEPAFAERDLRRKRDNANESILFLVALGLATGDLEEASVIVTTGLPTDDYERLKKSYSETIMNNKEPYVFSILQNGKEFKKKITVIRANVENQPKGTILSLINEKIEAGEPWEMLKSRQFAVCDIGFNTTDLSVYVGKDIVRSEKINFSTFAMNQIITTCKRLIEARYNCIKTEAEILEAVQSKQVKLKGQYVDCSEEILQGFKKNAELLANELSSKWEENLDSFDEFVLTGGTVENETFAEILKQEIIDKCGWEVSICQTPQFANALGFYIISKTLVNVAQKEVSAKAPQAKK